MKAIVQSAYGGPEVLALRDVDAPAPKAGELLVDVRAAEVTSGDARLRAMRVPAGFGLIGRLAFGIRRPRRPITGHSFAGVVAEVGEGVTGFARGDAVLGMAGGAHAERCVVRADGPIAHKPASLSFEQAAAVGFGGQTALVFLDRAKLQAGEAVLVNGACGAVGSAVVQLARHRGAKVTAVCRADNEALARSLGADDVIDYTREDFAASGRRWDVIVDTAGNAPFRRARRALAERGRLALVLSDLWQLLAAPWIHLASSRRVVGGPFAEKAEHLRELARLAEEGAYRPHIEEVFPLAEVREAHRRVDSGHKRGSVVLRIGEGA